MNHIPKVIHYCWFGGAPLPESALKCIESWQKHCPDYEIVRWDESNFDIKSNQYVQEAYGSKKWAFVTDYVRLYVLYHQGGIYLDTDVELLKSLDEFLVNEAFTGCENEQHCVTGLIGARAKHNWSNKLLKYYKNRNFILSNGELDDTTNTKIITQLTIQEYGWNPQDSHQILPEGLNIYPSDFFCAKNCDTGVIKITRNTYAIHHFNASWFSETEKKYHSKSIRYNKILGDSLGSWFFDLEMDIEKLGLVAALTKIKKNNRT